MHIFLLSAKKSCLHISQKGGMQIAASGDEETRNEREAPQANICQTCNYPLCLKLGSL